VFIRHAAVVPYSREISCLDSFRSTYYYPATASGTDRIPRRYYLKGIDRDITDGEDVIVTTDSGRLRGKRMAGIAQAGKYDHLRRFAAVQVGDQLALGRLAKNKSAVSDCAANIMHLRNADVQFFVCRRQSGGNAAAAQEYQLAVAAAGTTVQWL
jgi:hypothetical protein